MAGGVVLGGDEGEPTDDEVPPLTGGSDEVVGLEAPTPLDVEEVDEVDGVDDVAGAEPVPVEVT